MMVIFLAGLVAMVMLRILRKDMARYRIAGGDVELASDDPPNGVDDSGWKQVSRDVFRTPPNMTLLAALLGTGMQLILIIFVVIFVGLVASKSYARCGVRSLSLSLTILLCLLCRFGLSSVDRLALFPLSVLSHTLSVLRSVLSVSVSSTESRFVFSACSSVSPVLCLSQSLCLLSCLLSDPVSPTFHPGAAR